MSVAPFLVVIVKTSSVSATKFLDGLRGRVISDLGSEIVPQEEVETSYGEY